MSLKVKALVSLALAACFAAFYAWVGIAALEFGRVSRVLPMVIGIAGGLSALLYAVLQITAIRRISAGEEEPQDGATSTIEKEDQRGDEVKRAIRYMSWLIGFALAFLYIHWMVAIVAFLTGFLRFENRDSWLVSVVTSIVVLVVMFLLADVFDLAFPRDITFRF